MFLPRDDRRGVCKSSFVNAGIPVGKMGSDVESFRLVRNGALYFVDKNNGVQRQQVTHIYARRDGVGTLTAIPIFAPVVIASMKQITDATTKS